MRFALFLTQICNSVIGKLLLAFVVGVFIFLELNNRNDFDIYLTASVDMFKGENIYGKLYFGCYHYYYSTFFATLIRPLAELPSQATKAIWIFFNILLLLRIWKISFFYLGNNFKQKEIKVLFAFLLFLFCFRFIRDNLHLGQVTILILFLSLESAYQIHDGRWKLGALLLALSINIKLMPLVLVPYFLYRREWKPVVLCVVLLTVLYLLPSLWLGNEHNIFLLGQWIELINPTSQRHVLDVEETSFQSLTTLLATLFIENIEELHGMGIKRNIADISLSSLFWVINTVRLGLIVFTLWFLRTKPFAPIRNLQHISWELSYILLLAPLIFPHQQAYAFLFSLPAAAWTIHRLLTNKERNFRFYSVCIITSIVFLIFNSSILLGTYAAYYNHFKIVAYGGLLMIVLLVLTKPTNIEIMIFEENTRRKENK